MDAHIIGVTPIILKLYNKVEKKGKIFKNLYFLKINE